MDQLPLRGSKVPSCSSPPTAPQQCEAWFAVPGASPTAIFAASDEMAIGAMLAARDLGYRVPTDLSIAGIDGHELGRFFDLTTVDQFPARQGARAAARVHFSVSCTARAQARAAEARESGK